MSKVSVHDYQQELNCVYRGENYLVRDNGAVFRKRRSGKRKRPLDETWTFGNPCDHSGYMKMSEVVVHRIIATAFHGEPPSEEHVVDHIDTNRRNNRPENLRGVTRLENILLNPATYKKIVAAYGSIEAFFDNPQNPEIPRLLGQYDWMRTVSKEEAQTSLERMTYWATSGYLPRGGEFGEWLFGSIEKPEPMFENADIESLTPNAFQRNWKWPCEFPACPKKAGEDALLTYRQGLTLGSEFTRNQFRSTFTITADINQDNSALIILCDMGEDAVKRWVNSRVTVEDGEFCHENLGSCFTLEGAQKRYCLAVGRKRP